MKFKQIRTWIKGLYKNKFIESRIPDDALTFIKDFDIDETGKLIRRWGYKKWEHFQSLIDYAISQNSPIARIQKIYQYIDVGGNKRIFVIADGNIFMQFENEEKELEWIKLNKDQLLDVNGRIAITTYFDRVFFNDKGNNIWVYDIKYKKFFGYYIEFSGDKIYFYSLDTFLRNVALEIWISDDISNDSEIGKKLYDDIIAVGVSTIDINWFEKDTDGNYYLSNQGNTGSSSKQFFKINKKLVFQDWIQFADEPEIDISGVRIKQFGLWGDRLYIWGAENRITVIDTFSFTEKKDETILRPWFRFPRDEDGIKISYLAVDSERIYMYSNGVDPDVNIPLYSEKQTIPLWTKQAGEYDKRWDSHGWRSTPERTHHNYNDDVAMQNEYSYWGYRAFNPEINVYKKIGNSNAKVLSSYSDWSWETGKNFDDDWYVRFLKRQNQQEGYFSPLSCYFRRTDRSIYVYFRHFRVYIKSDFFLKNSIGNEILIMGEDSDSLPPYINEYAKNNIQYKEDSSFESDIIFLGKVYSPNETSYDGIFCKVGNVYNTSIFSSPTISKYNALLTLDKNTGNMYSKYGMIRWLPLTLLADGVEKYTHDEALNPIFVYRGLLHFGDKFDDEKYLYSYDLDTTQFKCKKVVDTSLTYPITMNKFLESALLLNLEETKSELYEKVEDMVTGNRIVELDYYLKSNISDWESVEIQYVIHRLNTPRCPKYRVVIDDTSTLKAGSYRYAMVYRFVSGQKTLLGIQTEPIQIGADDNYAIDVYGLDLGAYYSTGTADDDVEAIEIYRQDSSDGITWDELPFLAETITDFVTPVTNYYDKYANSDVKYTPKSYYQETLSARRFKFNQFLIHKNQFVMINKLDEENSNLIMYSAIDNPENIPPDNVRPIESGDGDTLVVGISVRDYCYLVKQGKIYAILGSVDRGQLLDISKKIGCQNPNLIGELNDIVYFLNQYGIYHIAGNRVVNIEHERLRDYFDTKNPDSINFSAIDRAFIEVDRAKSEIKFHIPIGDSTENNRVFLYNQKYNYWRDYEYYDPIMDENSLFDIQTNKFKTLLSALRSNDDGTVEPKIFELMKENNDDGHKIKWKIKTKAFDIGTVGFNKIYRLVRIAGKYFTDIVLNYTIDNDYRWGEPSIRKAKDIHIAETMVYNGIGKKMQVEISSEDANRSPAEIDEIVIGYDKLARMR